MLLATPLERAQAWKWLKSKEPRLAARLLQIRDEVSKWLPLIVQFYAHYPSHGVDHSDRIVEQLSRLLYAGNRPVVRFSPAEIYCLLAAAYLHDAGMVVSPHDATLILESSEWKAFTSPTGAGYQLYRDYEVLLGSIHSGTNDRAAFIANQSLRYLIADFVRRNHHERGKTTLELHPFLKQLVDDGDSVAFETISDLGVAHGVRDKELADDARFPDERDVFEGKVNVRFMARLLRIGDLLDMSTRRADPVTARAVGPVPRESIPHWQQYSAKKHENISPNVIEFTFECKNQEVHRVLRDWLGWLEDEVRATALEQIHSSRHSNWKSPRCDVSPADTVERAHTHKSTIFIIPARRATYTFHDWKIEIDPNNVLQRLVHDVYQDPTDFLRELLQNSLDATRCKMCSDFVPDGDTDSLLASPNKLPYNFRRNYPIRIHVCSEDVELSSDGPIERRRVITIEDNGVGMDEEIIRKYFLQIGRSYYQSNEFREKYRFAPTSRFGVGFLSVFAASNDIRVDTSRRDGDSVVGTRLRLREPRSYLLTEKWMPPVDFGTGTRIRIVLDPAFDFPHDVVQLVRNWCVAVEVPIVVQVEEKEETILPTQFEDGAVVGNSSVNPNGRFVLRRFEVNAQGVEGEIAVIAYVDERGEAWCDCWPSDRDLGNERIDKLPELHGGFTALHGIWFGGPPVRNGRYYGENQWLQQCDVRSNVSVVPMSREKSRQFFHDVRRNDSVRADGPIELAAKAVVATAESAVEQHLQISPRALGDRGIYYVGNVLTEAPISVEWRERYPRTVPTWKNRVRCDLSVEDVLGLKKIGILLWASQPSYENGTRTWPRIIRHPRDLGIDLPLVSWNDLPDFCHDRMREKIWRMHLESIVADEDLRALIFDESVAGPGYVRAHPSTHSWLVPESLNGPSIVMCDGLDKGGKKLALLDSQSEIVCWMSRVRSAVESGSIPIDKEHVLKMWEVASDRPYNLSDVVNKWAESPEVPIAFRPVPKPAFGRMRVDYVSWHPRVTINRYP